MERKFFLGVGILVVLLVFCLLMSFFFNRWQEPIIGIVDQAIAAGQEKNLDAGRSLIRQAQDGWEKHWKAIASLSDHEPMEQIDGLFAQITACNQEDGLSEFLTSCAQLRSLLQVIANDQTLRWWYFL